MKTIALIGALDTKGPEYLFVKNEIERRGHRAFVIDTAVMSEPAFAPDVSAADVAQAGGTALTDLRATADRTQAMQVMTRGIAALARNLYDAGKFDAVLALGGGNGTVIATSAMRALPLGVPKVMVSTLAAGDVKAYVGTSDIVMLHSVVDVAGVNRISGKIYANAVGAVVGMAETELPKSKSKPLIAASMFGNTTPAVTRARETLEMQGYEVLVFHATGMGGATMEQLIRDGYFEGVFDITTTEWADELVGGVLGAGTARLEAAADKGVPQVIAPGCLDMVNFWARATVPPEFDGRLFYEWNPNITLMRTTAQENAALGKILAEKVNRATAPTAFFLPLRGVSQLDSPGQAFWDPDADRALFDAIKHNVRADIPVYELDYNINDDAFVDAMTTRLLEMIG
ncbi:MAG: Tm-1-like ATP-binding domain-containing protein [Anaerolineae bacterium]|nr:Tm-1-like ATP-binding domain-containing protein [Anaerolineae bacterium]